MEAFAVKQSDPERELLFKKNPLQIQKAVMRGEGALV